MMAVFLSRLLAAIGSIDPAKISDETLGVLADIDVTAQKAPRPMLRENRFLIFWGRKEKKLSRTFKITTRQSKKNYCGAILLSRPDLLSGV